MGLPVCQRLRGSISLPEQVGLLLNKVPEGC
jgi:hypothetical protein